MNDDPASLDKLHDIVRPAPVPWWPPAPGWYVVLAAFVVVVAVALVVVWKRWQNAAYRRTALAELAEADSVSAVSELLRRTALVIAPRSEIALQTGAAWPDWLSKQCAIPIPDHVRDQLTDSGYGTAGTDTDISSLRVFAGQWIKLHRSSEHSVDQASNQ